MEQTKEKWYFRVWALVAAFLCIGPFMLPMVWCNPRFSKKAKALLSALVLILTYLLGVLFLRSLKAIVDYYKFILPGSP